MQKFVARPAATVMISENQEIPFASFYKLFGFFVPKKD